MNFAVSKQWIWVLYYYRTWVRLDRTQIFSNIFKNLICLKIFARGYTLKYLKIHHMPQNFFGATKALKAYLRSLLNHSIWPVTWLKCLAPWQFLQTNTPLASSAYISVRFLALRGLLVFPLRYVLCFSVPTTVWWNSNNFVIFFHPQSKQQEVACMASYALWTKVNFFGFLGLLGLTVLGVSSSENKFWHIMNIIPHQWLDAT